jgi:hypothetical protein
MTSNSTLFLSGAAALVAVLPFAAVAADSATGSGPGEASANIEAPRPLYEHPAVVIHRQWKERGYDYASNFYPHPARLDLLSEAPRETGEQPAVLATRTEDERRYDEGSSTSRHPALSQAATTQTASQDTQSILGL